MRTLITKTNYSKKEDFWRSFPQISRKDAAEFSISRKSIVNRESGAVYVPSGLGVYKTIDIRLIW